MAAMTAAMAAIPQIHAMFEPVAATGDAVGVAEDAGRGVGALGTGCVGAVVGCGCGVGVTLGCVGVGVGSVGVGVGSLGVGAGSGVFASCQPYFENVSFGSSPYIVMTSIVPHGTWFPLMRTLNGVGPFAGSLCG
ncbi:hypothetical protein [Bifidobacterium criceti]|nr:hypothetical protein [Bifidobacterium criceti]